MHVFRSFYHLLCPDKILTPTIDHPIVSNEKLHLLFDPTHNLKNIYNNWLSKKTFHFPSSRCADLPEYAHFQHIIDLFQLEETKKLKIAHSLTKTALMPNNIQKTSPRHALSKLMTIIRVVIVAVLQYLMPISCIL